MLGALAELNAEQEREESRGEGGRAQVLVPGTDHMAKEDLIS